MSHLTPKTVARALGVSESSVKRWCDQGLIETTKTAGGHRRLLLASVLEFLRQQKFELVRPEVLGLPVTGGSGERSLQRARSRLLDALLDGDETSALRVLMDLHVAGHRVASICDEVVSAVFTEIGERWACGSADVFQERRACEICSRGLDALRRTLPAPSAGAPHALGCAPDRDPYTLATTAIEVVLTQAGWRATSLGSRIPFPSLERAIVRYQPRLVWLSLSYLDDEASFLDEYHRFYESLAGGPPLIVGGRAWTESLRRRVRFAAFGDNFAHLEDFATSLYSAMPASESVREPSAKERTER